MDAQQTTPSKVKLTGVEGIPTKRPYRDWGTEWPCSHTTGVCCYHDSIDLGYTESSYCEGSGTSSSAQDGDIWWSTSRWGIADCVSCDLTVTLNTTNAIPLDKDWTAACCHSQNCLGYTTRNYIIWKKGWQHFNISTMKHQLIKEHNSTRNSSNCYCLHKLHSKSQAPTAKQERESGTWETSQFTNQIKLGA